MCVSQLCAKLNWINVLHIWCRVLMTSLLNRLIVKLSFKLTFWTWIKIKSSCSHFQLNSSRVAHIFNLTRLDPTENWVNSTWLVKNSSLTSRELNIENFPVFNFCITFLHYLLIESHKGKHEDHLIESHKGKHEDRLIESHKGKHEDRLIESHKEKHEDRLIESHDEKHEVMMRNMKKNIKRNIKRNMKKVMTRNMKGNMKRNIKGKHEDCLTLIESHDEKTW